MSKIKITEEQLTMLIKSKNINEQLESQSNDMSSEVENWKTIHDEYASVGSDMTVFEWLSKNYHVPTKLENEDDALNDEGMGVDTDIEEISLNDLPVNESINKIRENFKRFL